MQQWQGKRHSGGRRSGLSTAVFMALAYASSGQCQAASSSLQAAEVAPADALDAVTLAGVVVTGSRRALRSALDAAAPVDIISAETLAHSGETDLSKALAKLSAAVSLPTTPAGGFSASVPPGIALRGLSSDQTLVLLNGKRRHVSAYFTRQSYAGGRGSAGVDLSLIPVSAVQRVEILRDGAAAQYGSDAIAGVVNIILKDQDHGGNLSYVYGGYSQGDGEQQKLSAWKAFSLPADGSLNIAFEAGKRASASNTGADNRTFYNASSSAAAQYNDSTTPYRYWHFGAPEIRDQYNLILNAKLPLGPDRELYSFASYGHRKTIGENFYEPPSATAAVNQSAYYKARYPDGRVPLSLVTVEDFALTLGGYQGRPQSGKFDLFATFGRNKVHTDQGNGINPSYGPESPSRYSLGDNIFSQLNSGLDYSRELRLSWLSSPLTLSTGVLYRWEQYEQVAGDPIAYTRGPYYDVSSAPEIYAGITAEDERQLDRDVYGVYLDVEADIWRKLNAAIALRSEKYSDFGETTNAKVALKYAFNPRFSLRGSASTGYRAPSLTQLGYSTYSVQTVETYSGSGVYHDVQQRTLLAGSEAARLLGSQDLEAEKSMNYSLGLVWRPWPQSALTLDVYQIDINNRILLSDNMTGSLVSNAFAGTAYANINNVAFFNNLLDTRTRGLELSASQQLDLAAYGQLDLNVGLAFNDNQVTKARSTTTSSGEVLPASSIAGRSTIGLIESVTPSSKLSLSALWRIGDWQIHSAVRRYGKWTTRNNTNPSADQTYAEQWLADLELRFSADRWLKGLKFYWGANNIFDSHPDQTAGVSTFGVGKYSFNSPEGANGSYLYAKVAYDF
jgi:iron complex outermembrane receptor protein